MSFTKSIIIICINIKSSEVIGPKKILIKYVDSYLSDRLCHDMIEMMK